MPSSTHMEMVFPYTRKLQLTFTIYGKTLRLTHVRFTHPRLAKVCNSTARQIPWTVGFRSMICYFLQGRMWHNAKSVDNTKRFEIEGGRRSVASSIYDSLEKILNWHELFGTDKEFGSRLLCRFIITAKKSDRFFVTYDEDLFAPGDVEIWLNNHYVDSQKELTEIHNAIEHQFNILERHHLRLELPNGLGLLITGEELLFSDEVTTSYHPNSITNLAVLNRMLETSNPFQMVNRNTIHLASDKSNTFSGGNCIVLSEVVENLIRDLGKSVNEKGSPKRFVSTNTSISCRGVSTWAEDIPVSKLVRETKNLLAKKKAGYECWRVFILSDPTKIAISPIDLLALYATLQENKHLGLRIAICSIDSLPCDFAPHFAEFHCIPGKRVFISVPPYYLITEFVAERYPDASIVATYTELADFLINTALNPNDDGAFEWTEGTLQELMDRLKLL